MYAKGFCLLFNQVVHFLIVEFQVFFIYMSINPLSDVFCKCVLPVCGFSYSSGIVFLFFLIFLMVLTLFFNFQIYFVLVSGGQHSG